MDKYTLYNFYIFFIKGLSQMLMTYRDRAISYKLWVAVNALGKASEPAWRQDAPKRNRRLLEVGYAYQARISTKKGSSRTPINYL